MKGQIEVTDKETGALSPLAELLSYLERQWNQYFASSNHTEFLEWLEKVAPLEIKGELDEDSGLSVIEAVDTLDSILLAAITELEQVENEALSASQLEDRLRQIWQRSYAYFAAREEKKLDEIFIHRGQALQSTIYPEVTQRRRLYRTSLPPRSGNELLKLYPTIIEHLKTGEDYAIWTKEKRFEYIQTVVGLVGSLPKFGLSNKAGRKEVDWQDVLRWWLDPTYGIAPKTVSEISDWYDYVSQNFGYRFTWGLGSVLALAVDAAHGGILVESTLEDWPLLELPWIAFWLKELIIWGTLDPVAAYLLAKNIKTTRRDAEEAAALYYNEQYPPITDELLNAVTIRNWTDTQFRQAQMGTSKRPPEHIKVELVRDFSKVANDQWRVIPVVVENDIHWFDPAGFPFAICRKPKNWESYYLNTYDFVLNTSYAVVASIAYL